MTDQEKNFGQRLQEESVKVKERAATLFKKYKKSISRVLVGGALVSLGAAGAIVASHQGETQRPGIPTESTPHPENSGDEEKETLASFTVELTGTVENNQFANLSESKLYMENLRKAVTLPITYRSKEGKAIFRWGALTFRDGKAIVASDLGEDKPENGIISIDLRGICPIIGASEKQCPDHVDVTVPGAGPLRADVSNEFRQITATGVEIEAVPLFPQKGVEMATGARVVVMTRGNEFIVLELVGKENGLAFFKEVGVDGKNETKPMNQIRHRDIVPGSPLLVSNGNTDSTAELGTHLGSGLPPAPITNGSISGITTWRGAEVFSARMN